MRILYALFVYTKEFDKFKFEIRIKIKHVKCCSCTTRARLG